MTIHFIREAILVAIHLYDLTFFLIVIVIIFKNLIFGAIIDTFADLRAENQKEEQLKNDCFIVVSIIHVCHHMQNGCAIWTYDTKNTH